MTTVSIVVDNPSWILPYAERLADLLLQQGHSAHLYRSYAELSPGDVAFFLGCTGLAKKEVLGKHRLNLVVHESALPAGRGFAPMTWQVLAGHTVIPVVLLEAIEGVDAGDIYLRDEIPLNGYELCDELRHLQGEKTIELCLRFMHSYPHVSPQAQTGEGSFFTRRTSDDSRLDPDRTLRAQFNLLRVVDNERYPAFFEIDGHRYVVKILRDGES